MKFKTQENESNTFLDSVTDLIKICLQFKYAVDSYNKNNFEFNDYMSRLRNDCQLLHKLVVSLNPEHCYPDFDVEYRTAKSVADLAKFEEKYYNMLKEIGNNALEQNDAEVFSYLSKIICNFKHYFCTLNEGNDKGEISR